MSMRGMDNGADRGHGGAARSITDTCPAVWNACEAHGRGALLHGWTDSHRGSMLAREARWKNKLEQAGVAFEVASDECAWYAWQVMHTQT